MNVIINGQELDKRELKILQDLFNWGMKSDEMRICRELHYGEDYERFIEKYDEND